MFFLSGIFHHPSLESFTRSKRFFSSYFKKPTFKSNFFSKFFTKARQKFKNTRKRFSFRSFSFKNIFKKYTQKPIAKKVTKLTTVAVATITFESFIKKAFADEKENIEHSLSYKFAQKKTVEELQKYFNQIAVDWIKNPEFAWKTIIEAIEREQKAQKEGNFVAYHAMPERVLDGQAVYTVLYNEINNIPEKKDCVYLRTFNDERYNKQDLIENLDYMLTLKPDKPDDTNEGRQMLVSLSPFLFQSDFSESALGTKRMISRGTDLITFGVVRDICSLYNINNVECMHEIYNYFQNNERILLQIVFDKSQNSSVKQLKKINGLNPSGFYVGDNSNNIFPNLYWSRWYGIPCSVKTRSDQTAYNGPELLKKMKSSSAVPKEAEDIQIRLMVTNDFQEKRSYTTHIVNIGGDEKLKNYENTQKELVIKVKNIIQKYQPGLRQGSRRQATL